MCKWVLEQVANRLGKDKLELNFISYKNSNWIKDLKVKMKAYKDFFFYLLIRLSNYVSKFRGLTKIKNKKVITVHHK